MNNQFYKQLQEDAERIVEKAAQLLILNESSFTTVNQKDEGDMATTADLAAEKFIIEEIKKKYPNHSIISEEAGELPGKEPYTWIIDPLDGTKEYAKHLSEYNCLLAVEEHDRIVAGVTKRNGINELYAASLSYGATLNGNPIHVSSTNTLDLSYVSTHIPTKKFSKEDIAKDFSILLALVTQCYRARVNYDEAKAFAWVARGVLDAHMCIPNGAKYHDIASGLLLVTESGGKVTDWEGQNIKNRDMSKGILASNGIIHGQVRELIQKAIR